LWELSVVTFPMNEGAVVTGVKAMSDAERAKHLRNIDEHRKQINRSQKAICMSLNALFGDDLFNDDPADDPALLEDNDDQDDPEDEGMSKAFLVELQKLAEQATALAST
jgi:hypothetical protein